MEFLSCRISSPIKKYSPHSHTNWEIVCLLEGEVKTQVGDKRFTLTAGQVMLIPPNVTHSGSSNDFFIDTSLVASGIDFNGFEIITDHRGDITSLLFMIFRICTEQEGDFKPVVDSLTSALCQMIKHELGSSSGSPAVEQIKKQIYENLSNQDFSLAAAISETGFDKDYFRRRFKQETGKTPTQYLTDMRIVNAKQLLADNKLFSIESIAHSCGFSDSLYFSTCFKKHVGVSPLAYRKGLFEKLS